MNKFKATSDQAKQISNDIKWFSVTDSTNEPIYTYVANLMYRNEIVIAFSGTENIDQLKNEIINSELVPL